MTEIEVKINGKIEKIESGLTLADLAEKKALKGFFAIEQNLKIINKEDYKSCPIKEGDEIEIVGFAGGG